MMGIVNVLTRYGARKKAAHNAKSMKHGVLCAVCSMLLVRYSAWCILMAAPPHMFAREHAWRLGVVVLYVCSGMSTIRAVCRLGCRVFVRMVCYINEQQASAGISTVNPDQYMQRFTKFITSILQE